MQQHSEEWFRARCGRITGSRFANAMAGKRSQAYRGLIDDLERERVSGQVHRGYVSPAMQWGIDHEHHARRWYEGAHRKTVAEIAFVVHPDFDFVGVSPDGLVDHDGLIEIKCPQMPNFQRVASSRAIPARYRWQVQGQLWVCQRDWLDFVCFYPPNSGVVIRAAGERADFDQLADRCHEINATVERRIRARFGRGAPSQQPPLPPPATRRAQGRRAPTQQVSQPRPISGNEESGWPWWGWVLLLLGALWLFNQ